MTVCGVLQLPTMRHGQDFVSDSCAIVSYLERAYPTHMARFTPQDPQQCGSPTPPSLLAGPRAAT